MGKLIRLHLKVTKPKLCMNAMCVYKFTLDTGFYYYGATTDLGDRISSHLKLYRNSKHSKCVMEALKNAKSIKFEFVRFVNDKKDLHKLEEYYLIKNVGLPKCLNNQEYITTTHARNEAINKVVQVDNNNNILKTYLSPSEAARENNMRLSTILSNCNAKFPITKVFFRRIDINGEIINPLNAMRINPSGCKVVGQYDKKMNFINQYNSISEAARSVGVNRKNISDILRGKSRTARGFVFREIGNNGEIIEPSYEGRKRGLYILNTPKKPIHKIDLNGNIIETYRSLYMAIKTIPIDRRVLSKILKRNTNFNGFSYKYA